jgi:psp operon transcriptional activator
MIFYLIASNKLAFYAIYYCNFCYTLLVMVTDFKLVGQATTFLDALDQVSAVAPLDRPVLVIGERGTGKELIAQRLHALSKRWDGAYITLNCAALPESLLEAELFGAEAGAFTGANRQRAGRFEEADGGTLFLDEIATLSDQAQEKLLRVIEYGQLQRLGSNKTIEVDVRVIGATNEDLPARVESGQFRADLLDRLSFEVITLPTLAARREDIIPLADSFARRMASELGWPQFPGFSRSAQQTLLAHDWPGNVRELKNVAERAAYRWADPSAPIDTIVFDPFKSLWRPKTAEKKSNAVKPATAVGTPLPEPNPLTSTAFDFRQMADAYEKQLLDFALSAHGGNQRQTALKLKLSYDQLRHALKKHGLL